MNNGLNQITRTSKIEGLKFVSTEPCPHLKFLSFVRIVLLLRNILDA